MSVCPPSADLGHQDLAFRDASEASSGTGELLRSQSDACRPPCALAVCASLRYCTQYDFCPYNVCTLSIKMSSSSMPFGGGASGALAAGPSAPTVTLTAPSGGQLTGEAHQFSAADAKRKFSMELLSRKLLSVTVPFSTYYAEHAIAGDPGDHL